MAVWYTGGGLNIGGTGIDEDLMIAYAVALGSNGGAIIQGNSGTIYITTLGSGFNFTFTQAQHGITTVRNAGLYKSNGEEVEAYIEVRPDQSVYIESNVNLQNYVLKIY